MRQYPETPEELEELEEEQTKLHAAPWQLELLKLNPSYVWWGNYEDYMSDKTSGWAGAVELKSWKDHWGLDELNECVNFYFQVFRESHECPHCEGSNLNPATKQISDDWYDFANTGRKWNKNITEVEVLALMRHGRLSDLTDFRGRFNEKLLSWVKWEDGNQVPCDPPTIPTAEAVNRWASKGMGHDGINHWVCTEARARHQGVYGHCEHCVDGRIYDEENAKVALQLWMIHPRKGCSRGVYIQEILEEDIPEIKEWLREAAQRNADRFSKI